MYSIHDEGQHEAAGKNPLGWQLLAHAQGELAHQLQHLLLLRPVHQLTTPQHAAWLSLGARGGVSGPGGDGAGGTTGCMGGAGTRDS